MDFALQPFAAMPLLRDPPPWNGATHAGAPTALGHSVLGNVVNLYRERRANLLVMGGVHGDESEGIFLSHLLLSSDSTVPVIPCLNPDGALNEMASALAKKGEKIFHRPFPQMGSKSCATCHIPSNHFRDGKQHNIGSVTGSGVYGLDGAMETPTLLSSAYTQPYFHDGSLATLGDVARWFENQYELGLSAPDLDALTAYLETVGHGDDAYEDTIFTLESEMEEFKFFLSTYEYIKGVGNSALLETLFQTIGAEIRAHKWDLQDLAQMPVLNRLAKLMDDAYISATAGSESDMDRLVEEYRTTYAAYAAVLK